MSTYLKKQLKKTIKKEAVSITYSSLAFDTCDYTPLRYLIQVTHLTIFLLLFNYFFIMGQIKEDIAYEGISYDYSTGEVKRY